MDDSDDCYKLDDEIYNRDAGCSELQTIFPDIIVEATDSQPITNIVTSSNADIENLITKYILSYSSDHNLKYLQKLGKIIKRTKQCLGEHLKIGIDFSSFLMELASNIA